MKKRSKGLMASAPKKAKSQRRRTKKVATRNRSATGTRMTRGKY